ncbi:MAG: beta-ketoacyl-ACP synthase II [Anaerolineae bacterium]
MNNNGHFSRNGALARVVVTGLGAVTPLGHSWVETWRNLVAGVSAGRRVTHFDPTDYPTQFACSVTDFDAARYMDAKEAKRLGSVTQYAWTATQDAIADAGLDMESEDKDRVGIEVGSAFGALDLLEQQVLVLDKGGPRRIKPTVGPSVLISTTPCFIAIKLGVTGPVDSRMSACATGITSLGEAMRRLQRGEVDVMIAGGSDAFQTPLMMASFSRLGAMSTRNDNPATACRPFCATRDGLILGEGATMFVLETMEHAEARGARILAEITGLGLSSDAYNLAAPEPTGIGAAKAMKYALREAGVQGSDVDYIAAHGTATKLNDSSETAAIKLALGESAYDTRVSSLKSMVGHMMGAAGTISAAAIVGAIQDGVVPPTINYMEPDPECDLNYVPNRAEQRLVDVGICNAFGFGGQNASMVIERYTP